MKGIIFLLLAFCSVLRVAAQNITAAEYFFDADPGTGKGSSLPVGTPASSVSFSATIPTASLSPGFHSLAIRAKDAGNNWSFFEWRTVYISAAASNVTPIVAAEFFIDSDPGPGAGTGLGIPLPGHAVSFSAVIPTASLQPGFHHLVIRTRDASGQWGLFERRGFYIHTQAAAAPPVTAAEYYIDKDPGAGNGTKVSIGASGNIVSFAALLPVNNLSSGFHTLAIRARNGDGSWGIVETRGFYIQPVASNMGAVVAAEYFLDADPGVGNGAPLTIQSPGTTVSQNFLLNIPAGTPEGKHLLAIRTKDASGVWGLMELQEITVGNSTLPLNWLSFGGKSIGTSVALQWKTANEANTLRFDVERSKNGIDFVGLGQVSAKGLTENTYTFDDKAPLNGLNYYRLKQLDKDGKSTYSAIVQVYFGSAGHTTLRLYPQPVSANLNILFSGTGKEVIIRVYDAAGRLVVRERKRNSSVLQLAVNGLAGGTYWLHVSDGIVQQTSQFVKQ